MYIFFVDLGVVVCVDTEWVISDFDTKIREKSSSWSWNKKSCLGLGLENYGGLEIQRLGLDKKQSLGLDNKVLLTSLIPNRCISNYGANASCINLPSCHTIHQQINATTSSLEWLSVRRWRGTGSRPGRQHCDQSQFQPDSTAGWRTDRCWLQRPVHVNQQQTS